MENFHTTADVFIVIILAYLGLTLVLGAKQLYFGKFSEPEGHAEKVDLPGGKVTKS
jgi:hypothetical protein